MADNDPYASIAKPIQGGADPYANMGDTPAAPTPSLGSRMLSGVEDFGKGVAKSYGSAAANIDDLVAKHVPGGQFLTTPLVGNKTSEQARQDLHQESTPHGNVQKVGNFLGNASQFAIPGGAEEGAVAKGAELAGDAAKFIRPVARIGATALSSGTVNRAQGGGFGAGAAAGALGAGAGEVLNAAAPAVAEKALGIRGKFDRSFNKEPGKAALEETSGIRPETVANSAKARIGELSADTEAMADKASAPPPLVNYVKRGGDIDYPATESSLPPVQQGHTRLYRSESPTTGFKDVFNADKLDQFGANRPPGKAYTTNLPYADYYRDAYGPDAATHYLDVPEGQAQAAKFGDSEHVMPDQNPSLVPARNIVSNAMGTAEKQNAAGTHGQLQDMQDFLSRRFSTGEQIPENVTPRELLDLRRGFNEEHGRWNPDLHDTTVGTGRQAYGALTDEFHRALPEAAANDATVSSLIPVKNRAASTVLNDTTGQKIMGRFGAHTGALTGATLGGTAGYRERGVPGAIAGGLTGLVAPELIASPEGQMMAARMMHGATSLPLVRGAILNVPKQNGDQE